MLGATLRNMLIVTDTKVPSSLNESPRCQIIERPVLVFEKGPKKAEGEDVKALNIRRRQKTSTLLEVVSCKGIQSTKLSEYQTAKAVREVGEGSGDVNALSFGVVTKLIKAGMTFKSSSKSLKAFKTSAGVILVKLDMFQITSGQAENSFIFSFRSLIQIGYSFPSLSLFFFNTYV